MKTHILYLSGLGDRYDGVRRLGLKLWRSKDVNATLVPMNWRDQHETFEQKLERLHDEMVRHRNAKIVLVGESAGGSMALAALNAYRDEISKVVTVCGMNRGEGNVSPRLYEKNKAFRYAMRSADAVGPTLTPQQRQKLYVIYSSKDFTVRPSSSLFDGVESSDLGIFGHMQSIVAVLFFKHRLITELKI